MKSRLSRVLISIVLLTVIVIFLDKLQIQAQSACVVKQRLDDVCLKYQNSEDPQIEFLAKNALAVFSNLEPAKPHNVIETRIIK